ncbi:MAG: hypothetical protein AAB612_01665 [Patescibacteria group bacterium]
MAKIKWGEGYQYYVEALDGSVLIMDLLKREGVLPGEVLRLVIKGFSGKENTDVLYKREGESSFSASNYHQPNTNTSSSAAKTA